MGLRFANLSPRGGIGGGGRAGEKNLHRSAGELDSTSAAGSFFIRRVIKRRSSCPRLRGSTSPFVLWIAAYRSRERALVLRLSAS